MEPNATTLNAANLNTTNSTPLTSPITPTPPPSQPTPPTPSIPEKSHTLLHFLSGVLITLIVVAVAEYYYINFYSIPVAEPVVNSQAVVTPKNDTHEVCNPYILNVTNAGEPCPPLSNEDAERQAQAVEVLNSHPEIILDSGPSLMVSDNRYELIGSGSYGGLSFVVVDIQDKKITDSFYTDNYSRNNLMFKYYPDKYVLHQNSGSPLSQGGSTTTKESIYVYKFGSPAVWFLADAELKVATTTYDPDWLYASPDRTASFMVISTTTDSLTVGLYEKNNKRVVKEGDPAMGDNKKIGEKTFVFFTKKSL